MPKSLAFIAKSEASRAFKFDAPKYLPRASVFTLAIAITALITGLGGSPKALADDKAFDQKKATRLLFILEEGPDAGPIFDRIYAMYKKAGRLSQLIKTYKKKVQEEKTEAAPFFILGRLHQRERELRAAERVFKLGLKHASETRLERFFHYRIGIVLSELQRFKDAAKSLIKADGLAREPELKASVLEELGRVYARTGRRKDAARAWKRILVVRQNDFFATTHVATLLAKERMFNEVTKVFDEAIKGPFANDPAAVLKLRARQGEIFEASNRYDDAAKAYQEVLARTRGGNWLRKQVKARLRRMYFQLGRAYDLVDFYKKSIEKHPEDQEPVLDLADAYEVMGTRSLARRLLIDQRKLFKKSVIMRERLLHLLGGPMLYKPQTTVLPLTSKANEENLEDEEDPDSGKDKKSKSKKKNKKDDEENDEQLAAMLEELFFDPAEWSELRRTVLEELITLKKQETKYYQALATEFLKIDDDKSAQKVLTRLQNLRPGIDGQLESAFAYQASGQLDKALKVLEKAAKENPGDDRPHNARGKILLKQGKRAEAYKAFLTGVGGRENGVHRLDPFSLRQLATVLEEQKMLIEAAQTMALAVDKDAETSTREDMIRVGQLYQRAEKPIAAGRWFLRAFEASYNRTDRQTVLTSLRENLTSKQQMEWLARVLRQRFDDPGKAEYDIVLTLSDVLVDLNRSKEAIEMLEKAAGGAPKLAFATEQATLIDQGKSVETLNPVKNTDSDETPKRVYYLQKLVPLYSGEKGNVSDILKAFSALRELAQIDPAHRWQYALSEGIAQYRRGHKDEAKEVFLKVLASAPANAEVFSDLAKRFGELGDAEAALRAADRAVIQEPRDGRRHWTAIELIRRHKEGQDRTQALLRAYRRFVRSGVNSQDLEQARDDLYDLLLSRSESLAARSRFDQAASFASEARNLAANDDDRARAQILAASLQLSSTKPLGALEVIQGSVGRYRKGWVTIGRTRVRTSLLASNWLSHLEGRARKIYNKDLAPRGSELFKVAIEQKDTDLLQRLARLFPYDLEARKVVKSRVERLIKRDHFEEALWALEKLASTAVKDDPWSQQINEWRQLCRKKLGESINTELPGYESKPRRSVRLGSSSGQAVNLKPLIYGNRLFYVTFSGELIALNLNRLKSTEDSQHSLAARFELGKRTPKPSVVYNLDQSSGYRYYYQGALGVASIPQSVAFNAVQSKDPARAWSRRVGAIRTMLAKGGRLYTVGRNIQALSPRTGHVLWRFGDPEDSSQSQSASTRRGKSGKNNGNDMLTLELGPDKVFAMSENGECVALNPTTGELIWRSEGHGDYGSGTLKLTDCKLPKRGLTKVLLVARGDQLSCLLAQNGKRVWVSESATMAASKAERKRREQLAKKPKKKVKKDKAKKKPSSSTIVTTYGGRYSSSNPSTQFKVPQNNPRVNLGYSYGYAGSSRSPSSMPAPEVMISGDLVMLSNKRGSLAVYHMETGATMAARTYTTNPYEHFSEGQLLIANGEKLHIIDGRTDEEVHEIKLDESCAGPIVATKDNVLVPLNKRILTISRKSGEILFVDSLNALEELQPLKQKKVQAQPSYNRYSYGSSYSSSYTPMTLALQRLGSAVAIRGDSFILFDPATGKRLFECRLAPQSTSRYGQPTSTIPDNALATKQWLIISDNNGFMHIYSSR